MVTSNSAPIYTTLTDVTLAKTSERRDAALIQNAATSPKEIEKRIDQESRHFGHEWDCP